MVKLQDILIPENIVLIDTSFKNIPRNDLKNFFSKTDLNQINPTPLKKAINETSDLIEDLKNPNICTIQEVTKERLKLYNYIFTHSKLLKNRTYKKNTEQEQLVDNLVQNIFKIYLLSKEKEIRFKGSYSPLIEMVTLLDKTIGLQQNTHELYGRKTENNGLNTDEKLTAAIYYLSMFSEKTPILITKDNDLTRLLGITKGLIGADDFSPTNKKFREAICTNPFYLYHQRGNEYQMRINSDETEYSNFNIYKMSENENNKIREKMKKIWKDFKKALKNH